MDPALIKYSFANDAIHFGSYPILHSTIRKTKNLPVSQILGINLNTIPVSIITTGKEIIFLDREKKAKEDLKKFAEVHSLKIIDHPDVWEIICRPFLDTETGISEWEFEALKKLGISKKEIENSRQKIKRLFFMNWEWQHLGHWDLLMKKQQMNLFYALTGRSFYWWTMELAARGL